MPFTINPDAGAALQAMMGADPPPPLPAHDVNNRRERLDGFMSALASQMPSFPDVDVKDITLTAADGTSLKAKWFTKKGNNTTTTPSAAVLYAHGGGMIALSINHYVALLSSYVFSTGVPILAPEYRLAPESPAPNLVTDVYAGLEYLVSHASELGVDPARIIGMGDSAGGGITASLAHYIKSRGPSSPQLAKQILIYPMLDDRTFHPDPELTPFLLWGVDDNVTGWSALLGKDRMGKDGISPVEAAGRATVEDARGLPPAYIEVGELDLFRDEDLDYVRTLGKAGVSVEFHLWPGLPHGFEGLAPQSELTQLALARRTKAILDVAGASPVATAAA